MYERETRAFRAKELRVATTDGKRTLTGYAAVFSTPSEDFGGWTERIDPKAFDRTLAEGADVRMLVEHDPARIIGRSKSGTLRVSVDNTGLRFDCDLPDTSVARDLTTSIERGDLDSCSFGFITRDQEWEDRPDGTSVRTLKDVDLLDTSVVCFPAYTATSVTARSSLNYFPVEVRSRIEARRRTHQEPNTKEKTQTDKEGRALIPDQCICTCSQCRAGQCGICSADPQCEGAERNSLNDWREKTTFELSL